ncbi:glycosyltransferase [Nicoliella lavandulae]|uniref:Glycosyltransferase family 2 protein n=1 Tax=Nicoliella lavandulae TaxID=3082954 RepID=A0ABU8SKA4_9LACO
MTTFEYYTWRDGILPTYRHGHPVYAGLILFNQVFAGLFFYFGCNNLMIPLRYAMIKKAEAEHELALLAQPLPRSFHPRVQLLYTTYNDFIPSALETCLHQTYDNVETIILDNSDDPVMISKIKQFAAVHEHVKLVSDRHNTHAKAGNLNHYLLGVGKGTYDYFVILDSDELIEPQFVEKCLKFFYYSDNLGILQCNHISGRNVNQFMSVFSHAANTFWPIQNTVRSAEGGHLKPLDATTGKQPHRLLKGSTTCIGLGHGVMVSKECMDAIRMFPHMVAEDLSVSFQAILQGFDIKFASQIYGNEEFPIDMNALTIRSVKFCSANFEFFKVYGKQLLVTNLLTISQKLDLLTFTLSVPIFAFQYISLLLCSIVFPLAHIKIGSQAFMLIPALLCYFSQTIPDGIFSVANGMTIGQMLVYEIQSILLYGSSYYITVKSTILALLGKKAKFNVTPKVGHRVTVVDIFEHYGDSMLFSILTIVMVIAASKSPWILMSFLPGLLGPWMALMSNKETRTQKQLSQQLIVYDQLALSTDNNKHHPLKWNS